MGKIFFFCFFLLIFSSVSFSQIFFNELYQESKTIEKPPDTDDGFLIQEAGEIAFSLFMQSFEDFQALHQEVSVSANFIEPEEFPDSLGRFGRYVSRGKKFQVVLAWSGRHRQSCKASAEVAEEPLRALFFSRIRIEKSDFEETIYISFIMKYKDGVGWDRPDIDSKVKILESKKAGGKIERTVSHSRSCEAVNFSAPPLATTSTSAPLVKRHQSLGQVPEVAPRAPYFLVFSTGLALGLAKSGEAATFDWEYVDVALFPDCDGLVDDSDSASFQRYGDDGKNKTERCVRIFQDGVFKKATLYLAYWEDQLNHPRQKTYLSLLYRYEEAGESGYRWAFDRAERVIKSDGKGFYCQNGNGDFAVMALKKYFSN